MLYSFSFRSQKRNSFNLPYFTEYQTVSKIWLCENRMYAPIFGHLKFYFHCKWTKWANLRFFCGLWPKRSKFWTLHEGGSDRNLTSRDRCIVGPDFLRKVVISVALRHTICCHNLKSMSKVVAQIARIAIVSSFLFLHLTVPQKLFSSTC